MPAPPHPHPPHTHTYPAYPGPTQAAVRITYAPLHQIPHLSPPPDEAGGKIFIRQRDGPHHCDTYPSSPPHQILQNPAVPGAVWIGLLRLADPVNAFVWVDTSPLTPAFQVCPFSPLIFCLFCCKCLQRPAECATNPLGNPLGESTKIIHRKIR